MTFIPETKVKMYDLILIRDKAGEGYLTLRTDIVWAGCHLSAQTLHVVRAHAQLTAHMCVFLMAEPAVKVTLCLL